MIDILKYFRDTLQIKMDSAYFGINLF